MIFWREKSIPVFFLSSDNPLISPVICISYTWSRQIKCFDVTFNIISVPDGFKSPRRSKELTRSRTTIDKQMMNGKPVLNGKANGHVPFMGYVDWFIPKEMTNK